MARSTGASGTAKRPRPKRRRTYHHGDLRRALVDAARTLLAKGGTAALTLRAAAREAGVSQAAPYRHFSNRDAMLAAVAEDGFRRLHARMVEGVGSSPSKRALQQIAVEYVRFALEFPAEYRVMFGPEVSRLEAGTAGEALRDASGGVMALLKGGIEQLQAAGAVRAGDSATMALSAWALVHGLVMLTLDGQTVGGRTWDAESVVKEATSLLMTGMAAARG